MTAMYGSPEQEARVVEAEQYHAARLAKLVGLVVIDAFPLQGDYPTEFVSRLVLAEPGVTARGVNAAIAAGKKVVLVDSSSDPEGNGPGHLFLTRLLPDDGQESL